MSRPLPSVVESPEAARIRREAARYTHSAGQAGGHDDKKRRSSREADLPSVDAHVGKPGHRAGHCAMAIEYCSRTRALQGHQARDRARSRRRNRAARCHCTIERSGAGGAKPRTPNRHASRLSPAEADKRPACGVLMNLGRPFRSAWLTAVKGGPLSGGREMTTVSAQC